MMKLTRKLALTPLFLATLASCGAPSADKSISKSEARATALDEWTEDYCLVEAWYGDGTCDDFCPVDDPDCSVDPDEPCDCGPQPAIAMICDDGSTATSTCERNDEGVCEAGFECPVPDACECGPAPLSAWMCDDGSLGTYECVVSDDGCGYEPTCSGTEPSEPGEPGDLCDECTEIPAIARICDDGTTADTVCRVNEDRVCTYAFECPE